jgi:hypothetical protein
MHYKPKPSLSRVILHACLLVLLQAMIGCVAVNSERRSDMPVAAARQLAQSTQVTVEGIVTVASGTLDDGFAVQDGSGGIYVTRTKGTAAKVGDRIRFSGRIVAPNNQIAIERQRSNSPGPAACRHRPQSKPAQSARRPKAV